MQANTNQSRSKLFESLRDDNRPLPRHRTERKEAGLLGPTKSRLASNLAVLGFRAQAALSPKWANGSGRAIAPDGFKTTKCRCPHTWEIPVKRVFWGFRIGPAMSSMLKPCWLVALKQSIMEPSWAEDAAKWAQVGAKLGPCWPKLTPSGADVGAMSDRNNTLVRCCADVENVHVHFLATSPPLPAEAVPVNRGLFESIGSAPKLSPPGPRMHRRHLWCWRIFRHSLSILFLFLSLRICFWPFFRLSTFAGEPGSSWRSH